MFIKSSNYQKILLEDPSSNISEMLKYFNILHLSDQKSPPNLIFVFEFLNLVI